MTQSGSSFDSACLSKFTKRNSVSEDPTRASGKAWIAVPFCLLLEVRFPGVRSAPWIIYQAVGCSVGGRDLLPICKAGEFEGCGSRYPFVNFTSWGGGGPLEGNKYELNPE